MSIITLQLPPGVYKNSTPYGAKMRWADSSRVRWHEGSLRPIGGWLRHTDDTGAELPQITTDLTQTFRDMYNWAVPAGGYYYAFGSNASIYVLAQSGDAVDITPVDLVTSGNEASVNEGYGRGTYGSDVYGAPEDAVIGEASLQRWQFDNWGNDLMIFSNNTIVPGAIYSYSPADDKAVVVPNAPSDVVGGVVTDERIVMTIGSALDPRMVRWSDRENREEWELKEDNQAGFQKLQGTGALVSINTVLNNQLILSESDAHVGQYQGSPFIYGFTRVADNCGPVCANVVLTSDRFTMWLGRRNFWLYDGTVREVPCDVMDFLSKDIDPAHLLKMHGAVIANFKEMWWFYQSVNGSDIDSYVSYDYIAQHWQVGKLERTCSLGGTVSFDPLMVGLNNRMYDHEQTTICVKDAYATTGPLELGEGEVNMAVRYIYPDSQTFGAFSYTLLGKSMPTQLEYEYGPYDYNDPVATRAMGRQIRMHIAGDPEIWEVGPYTRFDVAPVGTGRR